MPGIYKVGKTNNRLTQRANELYTTGVPTPFKIEAQYQVYNCDAVERRAHFLLHHCRVNKGREFFKQDKTVIEEAILAAIDATGDMLGKDSVTFADLELRRQAREKQKQITETRRKETELRREEQARIARQEAQDAASRRQFEYKKLVSSPEYAEWFRLNAEWATARWMGLLPVLTVGLQLRSAPKGMSLSLKRLGYGCPDFGWNAKAVFQKYLLLSLCLPFLWGAVEGFIEQDRAVQKLNALESHCVIQKFKNGGEVSRKTPECLWAVDGNRYLVWKETQGNKAIGVAIKHTLLGVCFSLIAGYFVQTYLLRVPVPNDSEIA